MLRMLDHWSVQHAEEPTMAIRALLADDNALFRIGLTGLLQQCRDVDVVGQARNTDEALRQRAVLRLDVVLLGHAMPFASGVDVTKQLLTPRFQVRICLLAVSEQAPDVFEAVAAGARGYLPRRPAWRSLTPRST